MTQQPFLALDAPAKAGQRTIGADDPMTGNDDGDWIAAIRQPNRPRSIGIVQAFGELPVAARFAERYFCQLAPNALLKFGARHAQRQIEFAALTGEVFVQLTRGG